jgi:hypothetical protein
MKQIFFTCCRPGTSNFVSNGGQGCRKTTSDVPPLILREIEQQAGYRAPDNSEFDTHPDKAPARLVFSKLSDGSRFIVHAVHAGVDQATNRPGNYFSHVLWDLPPEIGALDAIATWNSNEWIRVDDEAVDLAADRDALQAQHSPAVFPKSDDVDSIDIIQHSLNALFARPHSPAVVLRTDTEETAKIIQLISLVLPGYKQKQLSFSTYDDALFRNACDIVGLDPVDEYNLPLLNIPNSFVLDRKLHTKQIPTNQHWFTERVRLALMDGSIADFTQRMNAFAPIDDHDLKICLSLMDSHGTSLTDEQFIKEATKPSRGDWIVGQKDSFTRLLSLLVSEENAKPAVGTTPEPRTGGLLGLFKKSDVQIPAKPVENRPRLCWQIYPQALAIVHEAIKTSEDARLWLVKETNELLDASGADWKGTIERVKPISPAIGDILKEWGRHLGPSAPWQLRQDVMTFAQLSEISFTLIEEAWITSMPPEQMPGLLAFTNLTDHNQKIEGYCKRSLINESLPFEEVVRMWIDNFSSLKPFLKSTQAWGNLSSPERCVKLAGSCAIHGATVTDWFEFLNQEVPESIRRQAILESISAASIMDDGRLGPAPRSMRELKSNFERAEEVTNFLSLNPELWVADLDGSEPRWLALAPLLWTRAPHTSREKLIPAAGRWLAHLWAEEVSWNWHSMEEDIISQFGPICGPDEVARPADWTKIIPYALNHLHSLNPSFYADQQRRESLLRVVLGFQYKDQGALSADMLGWIKFILDSDHGH